MTFVWSILVGGFCYSVCLVDNYTIMILTPSCRRIRDFFTPSPWLLNAEFINGECLL